MSSSYVLPQFQAPNILKNYQVFSCLSNEFDYRVRSMTRFELEFSSKIILGEGFRDKKLRFGYWLQHLQIVNPSFLFCRMGQLMTYFSHDLYCHKFCSQVLVNPSTALDINNPFLLSVILCSYGFQDTKLFLYHWSLLGFFC